MKESQSLNIEPTTWVPLRQPGLGVPTGYEYGQFSWENMGIPHATQIELQIQHLNSLLRLLKINYMVEMRSTYISSDSETTGTPQSNISPSGEATIAHVTQKVKKPKLSDVHVNPDSQKAHIGINFSEIEKYILNKNPKLSSGDETFLYEYSRLVNEAMMKSISKLIYSKVHTPGEMQHLILSEVAAIIMILAMMLPFFILMLTKSLVQSEVVPLTAAEIALIAELGYFGIHLSLHAVKNKNYTPPLGTYHKYIEKQVIKRNFTPFFLPTNSISEILIPRIQHLLWYKKIVRQKRT